MKAGHLFICGYPRSATVALWRLLVSHPKIVLGKERYSHISDRLTPDLFERSRFFNPKEGDTSYNNSDLDTYYSAAARSFDDAAWIGDNIPELYQWYHNIETRFPHAKIIYIMCSRIDVSSPYDKRAKNLNTEAQEISQGSTAVCEWGRSIKRSLDFLSDPARKVSFRVIDFEELFLQPADLSPIFEWLGLDSCDALRDEYKALVRRSRELIKERRGMIATQDLQNYLNESLWLYRALFVKRTVLYPLFSDTY